MRINTTDPDLQTIFSRINDGSLDLQPDFQRAEVWKSPKKKLLVDTILRGWQIPPVHVIFDEDSCIQEVLDGQQRLTTIHLFLISIYFRLRELNEAEEDIIRHVRYKDKEFLRLNNIENQVFFKTLLIEEDYYKITELEFENKTEFNLKNAREYFYNKVLQNSENQELGNFVPEVLLALIFCWFLVFVA